MAAPGSDSASAVHAPGPPSAAAARAFLAKLQETAKSHLAQQRPWHELYDRNTIGNPENYTEALNRVKKNAGYFRVNYAVVLLAAAALSMMMSPLSIVWLVALILMWGYVFMVRVEPIVVLGRMLNDGEKFVALCAISFLVAFGFTSVGYIVVSGLTIGLAAVILHAVFRIPDDLFLDDQDQSGFWGWLTAPAPSAQLPTSVGHV